MYGHYCTIKNIIRTSNKMNVFLTSLMHTKTASNFSIVERNFELMARSICSQTDQDFLLVVVCNSIPNISLKHKSIIYHLVDFPPAKNIADTISKRLDKGTKIISGLLYIQQYNPKYVHIIDADDWINIKLNHFLNAHELEKPGWYISSGYTIDLSKNKKQLKYGLNRFCGSTFISHYATLMSHLNLDTTINFNSTQKEITSLVSNNILLDLIDSHGYIEFYSKYKLRYKSIPFKALAWIRNTGENILSDGAVNDGISINRRFLSLFGLEDIVQIRYQNNSILNYLLYTLSSIRSYLGCLASNLYSRSQD